MNALVTVALDQSRAVAELTSRNLADYADKCGCEFVVIKQEVVQHGHPKFEKLQLYDLLATFDRIIYLDADILVMPRCPNLLQLVPTGVFGAFFDSNGGNGDAETSDADLIRHDEIIKCQEANGDIGWRRTYFNSGVMIIDKRHKDIFSYRERLKRTGRFVDQTLLNFRLQQSRLPFMDIGQTYNHFVALNRSERLYRTRFECCIAHYAGFAQFYPELQLHAQIEQDLAILRQTALTG